MITKCVLFSLPFFFKISLLEPVELISYSVLKNRSFFDLFYVAAAYQLGNVLREDPTPTGLLYCAGLFFPIQNIWAFKTYYDARFYVRTGDYLRAGYELALLLALASAVLHLRPVAILSHPSESVDMFYFCLSLCLAYLLAMGRLVEVVICHTCFAASACPELHPEASRTCARESVGNLVAGACFVAAAVHTGQAFYRGDGGAKDDNNNYSSSSNGSDYSDGYDGTNVTTDEAHHVLLRMLAGGAEEAYSSESSNNNPDNVAVGLFLGALLVQVLFFLGQIVYFSFNKTGDHKKYMVPMNVDYGIHRYGEWIMLMLGESVLSLLIVDIVETSGYYQVFVDGIISIVLLEYLHFQSQPSDPDKHAIRQSLFSSFVFYWVMQIYSLALIILGTSYKMFLFEFLYMEDYSDDYHRSRRHRNLLGGLHDRFLAGGTSAALRFSTEDRQQRIAHFFCGSLALVFFCMDVMSLAHKGFLDNWNKCECTETNPTTKATALLLLFLRLAVLVIIATLSQYETDPDRLAIIGLFSVVAQLLLRVAGSYLFPNDSNEDREEEMLERMVQYTAARVRETPADASASAAADESIAKNA